jgi:hypothetical protein
MKQVAILIFMIFIFSQVNSQITKGNWLVGGNLSYKYTKYQSSAFVNYKYSEFTISPDVGFFVVDKFASGIRTSLMFSKSKYPSTGGAFSYPSKRNSFSVGPFARYYFLDTKSVLNLFAEGGYQYQLRKDIAPGMSAVQISNVYYFNAGPVLYFNSSVGMEFTVGYLSVKYNDASGRDNTIQTSIGFQIHLEKDK